MKNTIIKYLYVATFFQLSACEKDGALPNYETSVTVTVLNEDNKAVENCNIKVVYDDAETTDDAIKYAVTDQTGKATTSARSRPTISIKTQCKEFYPTYEQSIINLVDEKDTRYLPLKKLNHSITLRKITNPIPLYAKMNDVPIPEKEKWIGFDLEKADWVRPYGVGIASDVEFYLLHQHLEAETINGQSGTSRLNEIKEIHKKNPRNKQGFLDSRDEFYNLARGISTYEESLLFRMHPWKGVVKMRVPFDKGGIVTEKENYLNYSKSPQTDYAGDPVPEMRMPHHAPEAGYQKEHRWEKTTGQKLTIDDKLGFFIKTRIKLDEKGNEISAHYAKFISDVQIDIRGRIKFTSYFNPKANDTNLEFDLKNNFFQNLKDEEKPFLP
jgi:hypothetical protein